MADLAGAVTSQGRAVLLLRAVQHVLFVSMVTVGVVRSGFDAGATGIELLAAGALLGWYWVGSPGVLGSRLALPVWLGALSGLCLAAIWVSADFAWVSFAVFVAFATALPAGVAVVAIAALALGTGAILIGRWPAGGNWAAQVVGPLVGASVAGALVGVSRLAAAESAERQRLVDELLATREDLARAHLAAGARRERERFTREIHDTLAQGFTSVVLGARRARHAAEAGDFAVVDKEIQHLEGLGQSGVDAARRLIRHLPPAELHERTLPAALALLSIPGPSPGQPVIDLRIDGDARRLSGDIEGALLRVAQEAMANAQRHAQAERVVITLTYQPSTISLDVVDDGTGFDRPPRANEASGCRACAAASSSSAVPSTSSPRRRVSARWSTRPSLRPGPEPDRADDPPRARRRPPRGTSRTARRARRRTGHHRHRRSL